MSSSDKSEQIDWAQAKKDTLKKIKALPSWSDGQILNAYDKLLLALNEPEVRVMDTKLKLFVLQERFEHFALSYTALFNLSVRRAVPYTREKVAQLLTVAAAHREGKLPTDKARGMIGDIAEGDRRQRDGQV